MVSSVLVLVGGIGLFLLGMSLLSDGVKVFAGDALRRSLLRFTGKPARAFALGALLTALVQSSSATTVTMIGFVSAGLLTFPQAVGVVLGASLGTTSTGWIVSVIGLKISIGYYALPMVGAGAFLKALAPWRWKSFGLALAGFGLIFVGIETMQQAMSGLPLSLRLSDLPSAGIGGRLLAAGIGVAMTVVLQSSSAAVAATLTALHTGALSFEQAAAVVIGASIGTTVTGLLAAIGATVPARRTAVALVVFNAITGAIAFVLLPLWLWAIQWAQRQDVLDPAAMSLAAFHTTFVAVGAFALLPHVNRFSRWIERLLPDQGPALTAHLDDSLLHFPAVALEAVRQSLRETAAELFLVLRGSLSGSQTAGSDDPPRPQIRQAIDRCQDFFARIPPAADAGPISMLRVSILHALDHLVRLQGYLSPPAGVRRLLGHARLAGAAATCRQALEQAASGLRGAPTGDWLQQLAQSAEALAELNRKERPALLSQTASGEWEAPDALDALDALRWLNTVVYHAWRAAHHLNADGGTTFEETQSSA